MPPFRKKTPDVADIPPDAKPDLTTCLVTVTGPVKGHPPITIAAYHPSGKPKDAVNALKLLLHHGKLELTT